MPVEITVCVLDELRLSSRHEQAEQWERREGGRIQRNAYTRNDTSFRRYS